MALDLTLEQHDIIGTKRVVTALADIESYTSGGESADAEDFGLGLLDYVEILDAASDEGYVWRWDGSKFRAYGQDASGTSGSDTASLREADASDDVGEVRVRAVGV